MAAPITDTQRLEWLMARMYKFVNDRYLRDGQPREDWHIVPFELPRGSVPVTNRMADTQDMRSVIDAAINSCT